ncbi:MAG: outer membrane protein assembly factor BamE [Alphaproteobacteria bacterium]|nr:outer membrane protein assembly factor BamE [Alphaproteobacteria bacterium]
MKNKTPLLLLGACVLAACTPTVAKRGNMLEDYQMKSVQAGISTRSDVLRMLGSPTTQAPFDENIWYYIGQETEKRGILDPEVVKERIVAVQFAGDGTVNSIRELPKGSRIDIPIARSKTSTGGTDYTLMQQLLGNLGKFNTAGSGGGDTGGGSRGR